MIYPPNCIQAEEQEAAEVSCPVCGAEDETADLSGLRYNANRYCDRCGRMSEVIDWLSDR